MKTTPILRWPGGKSRMLKELLPLIRPHKTYVEAFAGGLALLLAKEPSKAEVINDFNEELVNLYRYAQHHLDALVAEIQFYLNSRQLLKDYVEQPGITGLQRAARYLIKNRISFGGAGSNFAVTTQAQPSRENVIEALKKLSGRLDKVTVENLSYEKLLKTYDRPETLWFLDPPYSAGKVKNYGLWSDEDMQDFASRVFELQGDWIVTVNDSKLNRDLFHGHELQAISTRSQSSNQRQHADRHFGELIIRRASRQPNFSSFGSKLHSLKKAA